jgi:vancomycin permeability regulator SanA
MKEKIASLFKKLKLSLSKRSAKKIFLRVFAVGVLCGVLLAVCIFSLSAAVVERAEERVITSEEAAHLEDIDCIMVLGCGVREDGTPTPMLWDRLYIGMELYRAGVSDRLLMSGDHGQAHYDEVNAMKKVAVDSGIDPNVVFCDHAGFSTYESVYRAKEIFLAERIVIVTQEYHLYRALYIAEKLGIEAWGVSSDLNIYAGQSARDLREIAARAKDFFYCLWGVEPTYLGKTISLDGNASQTDG